MNNRRITSLSAVLLALGIASPTRAQTMFTATLTNGAEPGVVIPTTSLGAPRPASFGFATFLLNPGMTAMTFSATINNIDFTGSQTTDVNDNLTAGHIHAGMILGPTFPVVWGFFGSPLNDNAPNDVIITPYATGVGGTISGKWDLNEGNNGTTLTAQLPNILEGRSYLNFHTTQFAGGEVRGTITAVPEPATTVLLGSGLLAVGLVAGARRRRAGR